MSADREHNHPTPPPEEDWSCTVKLRTYRDSKVHQQCNRHGIPKRHHKPQSMAGKKLESPEVREGSLLSPSTYDDDASSIRSEQSARRDQDTDSEDDRIIQGARTSKDIKDYDQTVLLDEEETDRLLTERRQKERGQIIGLKKLFPKTDDKLPNVDDGTEQVSLNDEDTHASGAGKRARRKARRQRKKERLKRKASEGQDGELMYEMEEGGMKEGSATGESSGTEASFEIDRRVLRDMQEDKARKRRSWKTWCLIHLLIAIGFMTLVFFAWKISTGQVRSIKENQELLSNGTALFAPTTILISLDGFRADFLNRGLTPRLNAFIKEGISPVYMNPVFPSVTFSNHFTLVTGLYPESHGIVSNTFWDPNLKEEFYYTHTDAMQPKWWGGEPLWVTAEEQGIRTAIHMWPGSEAHIMSVDPSFVDKFKKQEELPKKVSRILEWLDLPGLENKEAEVAEMRPQLIAAYVPNTDSAGHRFGPNSTEIRSTISEVDEMLDQIFQGLDDRNLTNIVNVVVVSDHGMATTDTTRLIQLEDIVDTSLIEHTDGWPLYGLRPYDPNRVQEIYDKLADQAAFNPNFDVYLRDVNMPERYHFSNNERIAPLWIVPKTGWAIVTKDEFNIAEAQEQGETYHPRGLHGYDNEHPLMRAIFVARGPAFPHEPNSRIEPFINIEVYNIICDSLSITPKPNNGTIRLPLKPIGLHSPETWPSNPSDPEDATSTTDLEAGDAIISVSPIEASSAADPNLLPPHLVGVSPIGDDGENEDLSVDEPTVGDDTTVDMDEEKKSFWKWVDVQLQKLKGALGVGKNKDEEKEEGSGRR